MRTSPRQPDTPSPAHLDSTAGPPAATRARGYRRCGLALRARPPRRQPRGNHHFSGCAFTRYRPLTDNPVLRRLLESAQYTSIAYGQTLDDFGVLQSVGSVGDA
jgi:hypothetical protein